jgi:hypothetical protein
VGALWQLSDLTSSKDVAVVFRFARDSSLEEAGFELSVPRKPYPHSAVLSRGGVMFLAGWLLHSIRLAAALGLALVAMQAPAVTREYQAALLQLVRSSDEEIAQRKASAQRFYGIAPGEDEGRFLAQLRAVEPSNAETSPPRSIASAACGLRMTGSNAARICCAR